MSREAYGGGYAQAGNRSGVVVPQAPPVNKRPSNPGDVTFTIPKSCVGAVIGKGGQNLKDLVAQYSVRVYIDKEDVGGKRSVTLSFSGGEGCQFTEAEALSICQGKIEGVVQEQLLHQQQQMQMQAGAQHEEGAFSNQEQPPQT
ncbi:hypothetical protein EON65_09480 [archaeon]|nr:MAG: hypothetical protein EON65_09480 [archaeon]